MKFNYFNKQKNVISNYEGAKAFTQNPEIELYTAVVTTGLNDVTYEKNNNRLARIQKLITQCNPEFTAKLAIYVRNQMYMRSIPMVLTVELAKQTYGNSIVKSTVQGVVKRADEITELLAYYQMANARTETKKLNRLSKQIQKGLAESFNTFDEYQFAKYNRNGEVKLRDALFLIHPKAKDEKQQAIFNKIAADTLTTPYTWETELSDVGQYKYENEAAKKAAIKQKWEDLIDSNRMGYMATMRNLRNIVEAEVSFAHIEKVCNYLSNEKAVANAKQLPFRFLAAYREIKTLKSRYTTMILEVLEDAVMQSAQNIKGFDGNTSVVIACDVSGSMQKAISPKSKIQLYDIGLMLGMLMQSRCRNVISGMFGDTWKIINMSKRNVLTNVQEFYKREGEVGYSTNGYLVIEDLIKRKEIVDKVMLFTDVQLWNSNQTNHTFENSWNQYKRIAPKAKLYLFDLAGYGQVPLDIKRNDVYLIAGWSDKIFDVLDALENGDSTLTKIKQITL
ncbi:TROVE domain-containing protein [Flavobacterium sp. HNIBRBA15423]|uniref:TROVE domain-containing protein n=1 Tax=Flavobacterium sp. HNIBRBA15423 TaxID=3458683 RepID=UPI0040449B72